MNFDSSERFMERVRKNARAMAGVEQLIPCMPEYPGNPWHIPTFANVPRHAGLIQTEYEVSFFMFALVLVLKPMLVVETGTDTAATARALGYACAANGFGTVITCDIDEASVERGKQMCAHLPVEVRLGAALAAIPEIKTCDLLFSDASYESRAQEVQLLKPGAFGVLHDTGVERFMHDAVATYRRLVYFPTPRGFALFQNTGNTDEYPLMGNAAEYEGWQGKMHAWQTLGKKEE